MARTHKIRAVAFEQDGIWVVQGVDYDVVAQAKDPLDAPAAFLKQFVSTILIHERLGNDPFEQMRPAPERFRHMFDTVAATELRLTAQPSENDRLPREGVDLRVRAAA